MERKTNISKHILKKIGKKNVISLGGRPDREPGPGSSALRGSREPRPAFVGSTDHGAVAGTPRRIEARVPMPPSSSPTTLCRWTGPASATPASRTAFSAKRPATRPPFMSSDPRPWISPSATSPEKGSRDQRAGSPGGTTST